jgi:hypothetical protein
MQRLMYVAICFVFVSGFAKGGNGFASPDDLSKIDRAIAKEPAYQTQSPKYCLLVFGLKAETRVWLVLDGDVLYVDRNGNGDLTEASERVELDIEASKKIKVGGGQYKGMNVFNIGKVAGLKLQLDFWVVNDAYVPEDNESELLKKHRQQCKKYGWANATLWRMARDGSRAQIPVILCPRPEHAQISHLKGPLTFQLRSVKELEHGAESEFDVRIGTPGLPTRNSPYPVFSPLSTTEVPSSVHPVARFKFPNQTPGKSPIKLEVVLDQRC